MRQEYPFKILQKRAEAKDAVTLKVEIPLDFKEEFSFEAGQFVGVTANIKGEEVHRSYSICSAPEEEGYLEISIKKVPQGKMSTYLVDEVKEGQLLRLTPPAGRFYHELENKHHHVMFAAGSGVTPMISIIKHLRIKKPQDPITLFYWNQSLDSIMFKKEVEEFAQEKNINIFLSFTREKVEHPNLGFLERCSPKIMKDCFYKWSTSIDMPVFYLCGPDEFMETIEFFLGTKGFAPSQIRKESFYHDPGHKSAAIDEEGPLHVGDLAQLKEDVQNGVCEAVLDGDTVSVEPEEDETILEAFLRIGESPPYSCMEGTCIACQCKVVEGVVEMPRDTFISDEEIKEGLILSCQAKIKSKKVKVDFDDF